MSKQKNKDKTQQILMWKLLRKHISKSQLIGFSLASLVGLTIVILAVQFHQDVRPMFNDEDSFLRKDYMIITREVSTTSTIVGGSNEFSTDDIKISSHSHGAERWVNSRAMTMAYMPASMWVVDKVSGR